LKIIGNVGGKIIRIFMIFYDLLGVGSQCDPLNRAYFSGFGVIIVKVLLTLENNSQIYNANLYTRIW